jgi:hypothetical protein
MGWMSIVHTLSNIKFIPTYKLKTMTELVCNRCGIMDKHDTGHCTYADRVSSLGGSYSKESLLASGFITLTDEKGTQHMATVFTKIVNGERFRDFAKLPLRYQNMNGLNAFSKMSKAICECTDPLKHSPLGCPTVTCHNCGGQHHFMFCDKPFH